VPVSTVSHTLGRGAIGGRFDDRQFHAFLKIGVASPINVHCVLGNVLHPENGWFLRWWQGLCATWRHG
jgi:hypothetical protein